MQSSMLLNQRSTQHFKLSKTFLNKKNDKHLNPKHAHTHTHTQNKSNQFYISKTHVFLVMAKSHYTCTCIKSSNEYCVLCVKNIARLHKCFML